MKHGNLFLWRKEFKIVAQWPPQFRLTSIDFVILWYKSYVKFQIAERKSMFLIQCFVTKNCCYCFRYGAYKSYVYRNIIRHVLKIRLTFLPCLHNLIRHLKYNFTITFSGLYLKSGRLTKWPQWVFVCDRCFS